jgi:hypothetical protein
MVEFSKLATSWKIILEPMTSNVVKSKVDTLMYVVLSKAEKYVPYGELVGTTMYNFLDKVLHKLSSL